MNFSLHILHLPKRFCATKSLKGGATRRHCDYLEKTLFSRVLRAVSELLVALRPCEDNVYPDPHGLRTRRHQIVRPLTTLDDERHCGVRRLHTVGVVDVNLFYGLRKTDHTILLD